MFGLVEFLEYVEIQMKFVRVILARACAFCREQFLDGDEFYEHLSAHLKERDAKIDAAQFSPKEKRTASKEIYVSALVSWE